MTFKIKKMKPIDFIFFFGILGAVCTAFALYYTWRQNHASSEKTTKTLENTTEIRKENAELKIKVDTQSNKIDELRNENTQLYKDLLAKSEELNKFLGGSDGYPLLLVSSMKSEKGTPAFTFTIMNESKYPIYDTDVIVSDFQFIIEHSKIADGKYKILKDDFTKSIIFRNQQNNIAPNSNITTTDNHHIEDGILYAKLKSRGNFLFEKIAFVRVGDKIAHGFMVYDENGNILKEWYGDNPTNEIKSKLDEKFNLIPKNVGFELLN